MSLKTIWSMVGVGLLALAIASGWSTVESGAQERDAPRLFKPVPLTKGAPLPIEQERQLTKLREMQSTAELWVAEINMTVLQAKSLTLNVSQDKPLSAQVEKVVKRSATDFTWFGTVQEQDFGTPGEAILVVKNGQVTGTIQSGADLYEVAPLGGGKHAIIRVDQSKLPPDEGPEFKKIEKQQRELRDSDFDRESRGDLEEKGPGDDGGPFVIRVLVAYTPEAQRAAGGKDALEAKIRLSIDQTNQSYKNSKIDNVSVELAHMMEVQYQESGNLVLDLKRFREKHDGFMDEVHALRDQHKADVCALVVEKGTFCGLASGIGVDAENAFCVGKLVCITARYTMGHEIGHLQGARHNWEEDDTEDRPYRANHGFWRKGQTSKENWTTIMSYDCPGGCQRRLYWSSPNVVIDGIPTGSPDCCDNASAIRASARKMSNFR